MVCPYGAPGCDGVSGLWFGSFPCWKCWHDDAPQELKARYRGGDTVMHQAAT